MPPKKRKTTAPSAASASTVERTEKGVNNETCGLLGMPVELLHLTSSHFGPAVECPVQYNSHNQDVPTLPVHYRDRPEALRALSQTCRSLRAAFLPLLWENMDVCATMRTGKPNSFFKALGDILHRTSEGLIEQPEFLAHIRYGQMPAYICTLRCGQDNQCRPH